MVCKRKLFLILILILFMLIFVGCSKRNSEVIEQEFSGEVYPENGLPKDQKVKLSAIFPVQGQGKEYMGYAIKTFEEKFPNVTIEMRYVDGGTSYAQLIQSLLKASSDKEMYDWVYNYGVSQNILIDQGKLEPQDDLWERSPYDRADMKVKDIVMVDELELFYRDGHMYNLPQMVTVYGLYYNKDMFEKNGWNEEPQDWHEFMELCSEIKDTQISPLVAAGKFPLYFRNGWGAIPYEIGGESFREAEYNLEPDVYKSHAYLMMFKRLEEFAKNGFLHPGTISFDHTQSQMEFLQGTAAMVPVGSWVANEMKDVLPTGFKWGFMPFPGNETGQQQIVLTKANANGFIWKNKPVLNKKWAKEFNLWLLNLDVQEKIGESGAVPARIDFVEDNERVGKLSPSVLVAMEKISESGIKTINNNVRVRLVANAEMARFDKVLGDNIVDVITLKKKAEEAVTEINDLYMRALALERK